MDLSTPMTSLAASLDPVTLEVLAGTESALSVSQIASLARRGTRSGHQLVLDRLAEHGLVIAEGIPRSFVYRLNRDHVLAEAVLIAHVARAEFLKRLTDTCSALDPQPMSVILFGSTARRESGPRSDVDLLLVLGDSADPDSDLWQQQMRRLEDRVMSWSGNRLEYLALTHGHLREISAANEPIIDSIRSDGLTLFGQTVLSLLADTIPVPGKNGTDGTQATADQAR